MFCALVLSLRITLNITKTAERSADSDKLHIKCKHEEVFPLTASKPAEAPGKTSETKDETNPQVNTSPLLLVSVLMALYHNRLVSACRHPARIQTLLLACAVITADYATDVNHKKGDEVKGLSNYDFSQEI